MCYGSSIEVRVQTVGVSSLLALWVPGMGLSSPGLAASALPAERSQQPGDPNRRDTVNLIERDGGVSSAGERLGNKSNT